MAKQLPQAQIIEVVDPATQSRIDAWKKENNPTVKDLIEHAMFAVSSSDELGHKANIFALLEDGTPAIPEAHETHFDYTTRVWP